MSSFSAPPFTARRLHCDDRSQALQWSSGDSELYSPVSGDHTVMAGVRLCSEARETLSFIPRSLVARWSQHPTLLCPLRTFASISSSTTCHNQPMNKQGAQSRSEGDSCSGCSWMKEPGWALQVSHVRFDSPRCKHSLWEWLPVGRMYHLSLWGAGYMNLHSG